MLVISTLLIFAAEASAGRVHNENFSSLRRIAGGNNRNAQAITDPEVRVAISRRSFDGWSWAEVAQELSPSRDAETVRMVVNRYFKENNSSR